MYLSCKTKRLKEIGNKGSALIMSITIVAIMSLLGVALLTVTFSFFENSLFYSDVNSTYFLAQAGIEQISAYVDKEVGSLNEKARKEASDNVQKALQLAPATVRNADGSINANFDNAFKYKYFEVLAELLDGRFNNINSIENKKILMGTNMNEGSEAYSFSPEVKGKIFFESCEYDKVNKTLKIITRGEKDDYKNRMSALIKLIPDVSEVPYNVIENVKLNKPVDRYDYLKKALVAQKNIIVTGDTEIDGDLLSFGTIPSADGYDIVGSPWNKYGGIIIGMTPEIYSLSNYFEFSQTNVPQVSSGKLNVNGTLATLSYIHLLQSNSASKSTLRVNGDTYTKAVRLNEGANFSEVYFDNDLYVMDNLQIDSYESEVKVNGNFYGFVDAGYNIDGSTGNDLLDISVPARTSSIILNGDSQLILNNEVYIGGSTFFKSSDGMEPYMTGISALKSSNKTIRAYTDGDGSNQNNNLYWYKPEKSEYEVYSKYTEQKPTYKNYVLSNQNFNLLNGTNSNPEVFPLAQRGMHFKGVWDNLWKDNELYSTYINTDNIKINNLSNGKIKGFSNGAVLANGTVYGYEDFTYGYDLVKFHAKQNYCITNFYNMLKTFITDKLLLTSPKLNYAIPQKTLNEYIKSNFVGVDRIMQNEPYIPLNQQTNKREEERGFVYYGIGDLEIENENGALMLCGKKVYGNKGIIYNDGNIYIRDGVVFSGEIISTKNIVLSGNTKIKYDVDVLDDLLRTDKNGDVNITGLFGLITYEVPDELTKSQRIRTNSIEVVDIKRI